MPENYGEIDRRNFLRGCAAAAMGASSGCGESQGDEREEITGERLEPEVCEVSFESPEILEKEADVEGSVEKIQLEVESARYRVFESDRKNSELEAEISVQAGEKKQIEMNEGEYLLFVTVDTEPTQIEIEGEEVVHPSEEVSRQAELVLEGGCEKDLEVYEEVYMA